MKYKCIITDQHDLWLTVGKIYSGELMIPPLYERESWLIIEKADDGYKAFVRSNQFERVFDKPDILEV